MPNRPSSLSSPLPSSLPSSLFSSLAPPSSRSLSGPGPHTLVQVARCVSVHDVQEGGEHVAPHENAHVRHIVERRRRQQHARVPCRPPPHTPHTRRKSRRNSTAQTSIDPRDHGESNEPNDAAPLPNRTHVCAPGTTRTDQVRHKQKDVASRHLQRERVSSARAIPIAHSPRKRHSIRDVTANPTQPTATHVALGKTRAPRAPNHAPSGIPTTKAFQNVQIHF